MIIYQDNILNAAASVNEGQKKTERVMYKLRDDRISLNHDKCNFNREKISYLGFQIFKKNVLPDPNSIIEISQASFHVRKMKINHFGDWQLFTVDICLSIRN